jgi:hypothetical protein
MRMETRPKVLNGLLDGSYSAAWGFWVVRL